MKLRLFFAATLAMLVGVASFSDRVSAVEGQPGKQVAAKLALPDEASLGYWLYLPENYDQQEKWPLLLFLHGAGERGENLELVKIHGPPKLIAAGKQLPFVVVSPQCPKDQRWQAADLCLLLDEIEAKQKIDKQRIYVTGLSMGGFGSWSLAAHAPDRLAAIAPICGGGDPATAEKIAKLPIWVFHGGKDNAVPIERSQAMVDALKKLGSDVKFTIYPDAGHDSWTATYNNPEFFAWLLEQKRADT